MYKMLVIVTVQFIWKECDVPIKFISLGPLRCFADHYKFFNCAVLRF